MTAGEAIDIVKQQADIKAADTRYDTELLLYAQQAIKRLGVTKEAAPDVSLTLASTDVSKALPGSLKRVRMIQFYSGSTYVDFDDWFEHNDTIFFSASITKYVGYTVKIFGFTYWTAPTSTASTLDCPADWENIIINDILAQFYQALAGNRRKYSIYAGSGGQKSNEDMKDSATYFRNLRDIEFEEKVPNV